MKKVISFVGAGTLFETTYEGKDIKGDLLTAKTQYIQEVMYDLVDKDAVLYLGLTELSRKRHWESTKEKVGLKEILEDKNIPYKEFSLKDGKNKSEMWENFDTIFNLLEEGDQVYVDVTHSFRSIPFIILSVLNYAKFVKNIEIKGIYYGAYEAKTPDNISPIFDLSLFSQLTDWTVSADRFLTTGDSASLAKVINTTINPILRETKGEDEDAKNTAKLTRDLENFSGGLYTARGNVISEYGFNLKGSLEELKSLDLEELKPLEKILERIYKKVEFYTRDLIKDIHGTVKLCRDLNLIQQAYTFLRENIINHLCLKAEVDIYNVDHRRSVENVLNSFIKNRNMGLSEEEEELKLRLNGHANEELAGYFTRLGTNYRNDLNHGGFRNDPSKHSKFARDLDKFILDFEKLVFDND